MILILHLMNSPRFRPISLSPSPRGGFTLIELLIVIAIIAILTTLMIPAVSRFQQGAWQTGCVNTMRQLLVATQNLANDNDGKYPWMSYPAWGNGGPDMKGVLKPYTGTNAMNSSWVGPGLRCPAAAKNKKQWIWNDWWWPHYRYNEWYAKNTLPQYKYSDSVLYFDTCWPNWNPTTYAHYPGNNASLNVGYVDGHVARMPQTEFAKDNAGSESAWPLLRKGWVDP